ncbi:MAG: 6-bladed beta-propeller [Candidatus Aminicenantales bacterium]
MKKVIPLVFLMAMIFSLFSQEMIDNPARPFSKSAGRIVELEEALRIKETGDQFFFKFPYNLKISPNGGIFVQDQDQLLQFSTDGKYLRNLFKKGQGPGEMGYLANYLLTQDKFIIHSSDPNKILWLNSDGSLWKEISLPKELTMSFLRLYEDETYYFQKSSWPEMKGNEEIKDVPQDLIAFSETSGQVKTIASFSTKYFLIQGGGARGMISIDKFLIIPWQKALAVSHTQEYLVNIFDLRTERVVRTFRRDYRRIKAPKKVDEKKQPRIIINNKTYTAPPQKFQDDIKNLLAHGDQLWVMTSTVDKRKGILFDVFDREGRYIDNFYLLFPHGLPDPLFGSYQMEHSGDCLFLIEKDKNEISTVVKYKLR